MKIRKETEKEAEAIVVFDGTSYFVDQNGYFQSNVQPFLDYRIGIVYEGSFDECSLKCDELNDSI